MANQDYILRRLIIDYILMLNQRGGKDVDWYTIFSLFIIIKKFHRVLGEI